MYRMVLTKIDPLLEIYHESWEHAVILTYTHDLIFFEREILRRLRENGCRNICVIVDQEAHLDTFKDYGSIKLLGKDYVIQTIRAGMVFHPKIYLFVNKEQCKVLIGSGNLTMPGFFTNKEVFSVHNILLQDLEEDSIPGFILKFIQDLQSSYLFRAESKESLALLFKHLPSELFNPKESSLDEGVFLNNLYYPLFDQIVPLIKEEITGITALSPYFDTDHRLIFDLKREFPLKSLNIITQDMFNNLDIQLLKKANQKLSLELSLQKLVFGGDKKYRNHAKIIVFHGLSNDYLMWGSANFTTAALRKNCLEGNMETVILKRMSANSWRKLFFDNLIRLEPISEKDFSFTPSEGYSIGEACALKLYDVNMTGDLISLLVHGFSEGQLYIVFNNNEVLAINKYTLQPVNETTVEIIISGISLPPMPTYFHLEIRGEDQLLLSNPLWVNNTLELERSRLDERSGQRRNVFKNPDYSSKEYVLTILDYIYNELKLEAKDLPKVPQRIAIVTDSNSEEQDPTQEASYYVEENVNLLADWSYHVGAHGDYDLYNYYVNAIYSQLGIGQGSKGSTSSKLVSNVIKLNEQDRELIKGRFRTFLRRYLRGIVDENYTDRVEVNMVLTHYTVITASLLKILSSKDVLGNTILDGNYLHQEYRNVHQELLKYLPGRLLEDEERYTFIYKVLPVILAERLADYYGEIASGDMRNAALSKEWLEYTVSTIDKKICRFKQILNWEYLKVVLEHGKIFCLDSLNRQEAILDYLREAFGYISMAELIPKISAIRGVRNVSFSYSPVPQVTLTTFEKGEPRNWIVLASLYWLINTEELEESPMFMVIVKNDIHTDNLQKIYYLYLLTEKSIISCHRYVKGNSLFAIGYNIDPRGIKDNYRATVTDVLKDIRDNSFVPNEEIAKMFLA